MKYMRIFLKRDNIFSQENIVLLQIYLRHTFIHIRTYSTLCQTSTYNNNN